MDMVSNASPQTLQQAILHFADYQNCHKAVSAIRWPDGVVKCPYCNSDGVTYLENARVWKCRKIHPKAKFSLKVGTIFEDSPIPLQKWLPALWLLVNCKNGISSYELARALGVTQKTAWFMLSRLRLALQNNDGGKLGGHVEIDETYIGGKARNMNRTQRAERKAQNEGRKNSWFGKVAVMGLLERHGESGKSRVRTFPVEGIRKRQMTDRVSKHVEDGANVYTDQLKSYGHLSVYYTHKVINHAEKYADGVVHTNGLENYWSLLKRALRGTYVSVEPFHLFRYLDEQAFRFNGRTMTDAARFVLGLKGILRKRLTYTALTGSELPQTC
jgi:transposase-like protein